MLTMNKEWSVFYQGELEVDRINVILFLQLVQALQFKQFRLRL